MTIRWSTLLILVLILGPSVSPCFAQHDFPDELQALVSGQLLTGTGAIGGNVPGFTDDLGTWFQYLDSSGVPEVNYVLCYRLGADSWTDINGTIIPMTGNAFLYCRGSYELSQLQNGPQFFLFLQNVVPDVTSVFFIKQATIDLRLISEAAFFDEFGEYCNFNPAGGKCFDFPCDDIVDTLHSLATPLQCIAVCCGIGAKCRLPGVDYVNNGFGEAVFTFATSFEFGETDFRRFFEHFQFMVEAAGGGKKEPFFNSQQFEIPLFQPGDTNLDGVIDLLDIGPFVSCLTSGNYQFQCDLNSDLAVDLLDIKPFVGLLTN